jgi:alkenylglycerophosphocholine/alkenylglycerophosphoethanolamine hydrolase
MSHLPLLACLVVSAIDWWAVAFGRRDVEYVAKPGALALLVIYASTASEPSALLVAALVFSLLGDVYLMLPGNFFVAGLAAFLLGHLAYIGCFEASLTARLLWFVLVLALVSPFAARILRSAGGGTLRPAVAFYMLAIGLMVASALAARLPLAVIGAVLFLASDTMIAWDRFVRPFPGARTAIIVTYHLGQMGLVYSLRG